MHVQARTFRTQINNTAAYNFAFKTLIEDQKWKGMHKYLFTQRFVSD